MKLSIITINYNNKAGLELTMKSVLQQICKDFEYIVVDGASTDGSVDVMNVLAQQIADAGVKVDAKSEKDSGLYNAMNKGVRKAQGEYVLMLNSGDYFVDENVIQTIYPTLKDVDIIQGNRLEVHSNGIFRNKGYGKSDISFLDVQRGHFLHQASFCKRELFERFGYFDEKYSYVSDTIFFIRSLGYGGASFLYIDIDVVYFDMNGFSNSTNPVIQKKHIEEELLMQHSLFPGRLYQYCIESERKVQLYDYLHKHYFCWKIVMIIVSLLRLFNHIDKIEVIEPYRKR